MGLVEALSYGVPCLVTKGTNMADDIKACDAGWIAENSSESISEAIHNMLNENDLFMKKSNHAYELAQKYSWLSIAEKSHMQLKKIIRGTV